MQRVLVIGSPGAGKSTLAHQLARQTSLPLFHLDQMHWLPGWIERDRAETRAELAGVLASERWIIDGNYGSILPMRLARCDTVVWLDYPPWLCLQRVITRWWQYRGKTRPDMTRDCPERLDPAFLLHVANFRAAWSGRNHHALDGFSGEVVRLRNPGHAQVWLAQQAAAA